MHTPFDATLRDLITRGVPAWANLLHETAGLLAGTASVLDSALAGFAFTLDAVLAVTAGAERELAHLEFESSWAGDVLPRLAANNALLHYRHGAPVLSVLILLRPEANSPRITGEYRVLTSTGVERSVCRYAVIRVWELSSARLLAAGPALAVLAPLCDDALGDPLTIARQAAQVVRTALEPEPARDLLANMVVLLGLRYDRAICAAMRREIMNMRDSVAYQMIFAEGEDAGRAKGTIDSLHDAVLLLGSQRFQLTPPHVRPLLEAISDKARLNRILLNLSAAKGWDDLLATP
jgi:predicted transposase YdaD